VHTVTLLLKLSDLGLDVFFCPVPLGAANGADPVAGRHSTTYAIWRMLRGIRNVESEGTGSATMDVKFTK
jgi:hypothetical protein